MSALGDTPPADPWDAQPFEEARMVYGLLASMDALDDLRHAVEALTEAELKMIVFSMALDAAEERLAAADDEATS